jgi:hypothetical protein
MKRTWTKGRVRASARIDRTCYGHATKVRLRGCSHAAQRQSHYMSDPDSGSAGPARLWRDYRDLIRVVLSSKRLRCGPLTPNRPQILPILILPQKFWFQDSVRAAPYTITPSSHKSEPSESFRQARTPSRSVSEPIHSLPQGCVWCIRCNHAIVHCNRIGDWSAGHCSIP